jgi:hypothetical protein
MTARCATEMPLHLQIAFGFVAGDSVPGPIWRTRIARASRLHTGQPHHFDAVAEALAGLATSSDSSSPSWGVSS